MKRIISLLFFLVLITACVQTISEDLTEKETPAAPTPAKETVETTQDVSPDAIASCSNSDVDIRQRGKVTLEYGNGQKETTNDNCVDSDELAFKPFKVHYYCEGLEVKSRLYNCGVNSTCVKGTCN